MKCPRLVEFVNNQIQEVERINPVSCSLTLNVTPLSTASLRLEDGKNLPERCWVEFYTPSASAGYFRARTPVKGYGDASNSVEFEHGVTELGDYLVKEEIQQEMAFNTAMTRLFSGYGGSKWQLGTISYTDTVTVEVDHDNVLQSILGILEQTPYMLTFNFSTFPWTLGVGTADANVSAEGRLSRNVLSATVQSDDSELATKVLASYETKVNKERKILWDTVQDSTAISKYGIVEVKLQDQYENQQKAHSAAQKYLNKHKQPKLSVTINGSDLYAITGESLDEIRLGKKYRLAIEGESNPVEEVIKSISYTNLFENGWDVSISLSEEEDLVIKSLNDSKSNSRSSSRNKKDIAELFYNFSDEDGILQSYIYMTESVLRTEFHNNLSGVYSSITQTAEEIKAEVHAADSQLYSYVSQTATSITSHVENAISDLGSEIRQTATEIYSEVHAANSQLYSYINHTATSITSHVEDVRCDLGTEIRQTATEIYSEVHAASSSMYTFVLQTATSIQDHVEKKIDNKVTTSMTAPTGTHSEGDMWVEGNLIRTWNDADFNWQGSDYDWTQLKGTKLHVYKDGEWKLATDETTIVENTDLVRTKDTIDLVAQNLKNVNGEWQRNIARLDVRADNIESTVKEEVNGLGSQILQTATQIYSSVYAANSTLYSYIDQTATYIKQAVVSTESSLRGSIKTQADRIDLVVEGTGANQHIKPAQIQAAINAATGQSKITLSADHIILDGDVVADAVETAEITVGSLTITNGFDCVDINCSNIDCTGIGTNGGGVNCGDIDAENIQVGQGCSLKVYDGNTNRTASWKSKTLVYEVEADFYTKKFKLDDDSIWEHKVITNVTRSTTTIYYLGR